MNYVLAGGGTGGHINPAIAIAKEIQKRDPAAKLLFIGTDDGHGEQPCAARGV